MAKKQQKIRILNQQDYLEYREAMAVNLLRLVKHHKKTCDRNCNILLSLMGDLYSELKQKKLTKKEMEVFF